jgi:RHS repeat-associated protein
MGEKFAANPVTGTGSMSVPIATSPGRSGFGPQLSLSYDSGAGNGPFGLGWNLSLPLIIRKTDKGLPRYQDGQEQELDSDVFILSGAEDLVPVYRQDPDGSWVAVHPGYQRDPTGFWVRDPAGHLVIHEDELDGYRVRRYRHRIEGLFARIERWSRIDVPGNVHWRSISKDNILTLYGFDENARIADPLDSSHIFSWLICESRDDKGNGVRYIYKKEDGAFQLRPGQAAPFTQAHQLNRGLASDPRRTAQRYLQRVLYGNLKPLLNDEWKRPRYLIDLPNPPTDTGADWLFEVRFDYGELDEGDPTGQPEKPWLYRPDAFSSYRSGFEVRTCRRCERVLMLHHIPDQPAGPGRAAQSGYRGVVRSTDFTYDDEFDTSLVTRPVYSFLKQVVQTGWKQENGSTTRRSLPPVEFEYTEPIVQDNVEEVDPENLENLPIGVDGTAHQWTDLHGEGIPGILSEQGGAWFYKRNWSLIPDKLPDGSEVVKAKFAAIETVALKPNVALSSGAQFMDLAGDGQPDLVMLDGPMPGLYEHDLEEGWEPFRPFTSRLNRDMHDPNLKFVDLDGDGHADVLISEDDAFVWHPSLAEAGFGPAQRVARALDEEKGPHIVFADGTQSIYLADLSGDGLTDIVRIRNGEACYWPNLGYGRFGAKVTMDNAPWFDNPDQFDHKRIRLADIDGSGTTDIIYLHRDGVRLYFNQSGNSWSQPHQLKVFPRVDDAVSIVPTDLLGNGTACLVWSSPLPGDARRPMRYVNLMGGRKPHLLIKTINNLGAETRVDYAPSTKFYLVDRRDGKPWISKLPFPVHVVERVETYDHISRNRFVTRYAYHHGYFDGEEREFRGFGMVEQWDTEQIGALTASGAFPQGDNIAAASHVPPVHTKTWFHTGVYDEIDEVSQHFATEYYGAPEKSDPNYDVLFDAYFQTLLPDTVIPSGMTVEEEREACRALKGSMLRQEVYADDADHPGATQEQIQRARRPYTVTEQNFTIRTLQALDNNRHAVFFTHAREAISYHYERNPTDPRIQHALTLEVDNYGNVLKQAAIGYGRRVSPLSTQWDRVRQTTPLLTYSENRVTNPIDSPDTHRNPLPCEAVTFELTGYTTTGPAGRYQASDFVEPDPATPGRLRHRFTAPEVAYEVTATGNQRRRPIEQLRTLYRRDELGSLLPLGELHPLALPGESYKLAITPGSLDQVYVRGSHRLMPANPASVLAGAGADRGGYVDLDNNGHWWIPSGRMFHSPDSAHTATQELAYAQQHFFLPHRYRDPFHTNAVRTESVIKYDGYDLLIVESLDAVGNRVTVGERDAHGNITVPGNDYRVLQPKLVMDPNRNRAQVAFDTLGMVAGTAIMGKPLPDPVEGDTLTGFVADLTQAELDQFMAAPRQPSPNPKESEATQVVHDLLRGATTRMVYDLDRFMRLGEPPFAGTIARESHVSELQQNEKSKLQISFSYSDGFGREIQKKIQAEPGPIIDGGPIVNPRWVGSGWTIFNNKGKPVRQYEPFFSATHGFEFGVQVGVSPVLFYDPAERVIATLHPNHTYEKVVFDPWQQTTYDANDTSAPRNQQTGDPRTDPDIGGYVAEYFKTQSATWQTWRTHRIGGTLGQHERNAALRAEAHADTPITVHFDTLGRPFLTLAWNRVVCAGHDLDGTEERYATRVELDIEGNQRSVRDAIKHTEARDAAGNLVVVDDPLGRIVMRYAYDMLGNRIHQLSMEAGARWMLNDVAGKPIRAWDSRGHNFATNYDALRRPIEQYVRGTFSDPDPLKPNSDPGTLNSPDDLGHLVHKIEYGEAPANASQAELDRAVRLNLRTRIYRHFDSAGVVTNARLDANGNPIEAYDFKGNLLHNTRRLATRYWELPEWSQNPPPQLESEFFEGSTRYDALNRPIQSVAPHSSLTRAGHPNKFNVIQPIFSEANLLERVDVWLERAAEPAALLDPNSVAPSPVGVANIDYDAKGQRQRIDYKNGTSTFYSYDPLTFRLIQLQTQRKAADFPQDDPKPLIAGWPGKQVQHLHYSYDPAGNITQIKDDAQQAIYFRNQRVEPSNDYTYDALYRLIQAAGREHLGQQANGDRNPPTAPDAFNAFHTRQDHPNVLKAMGAYIERYVYDAVGNFLQMQHRGSDPAHAGWTRAYDYLETSLIEDGNGGVSRKTSNRLSSTTVGSGNPISEQYHYDAHGNMLRMLQLQVMQWDYKDQLQMTQRQKVNDQDRDGVAHQGERTWYVYDAAGQRVRKVTELANNGGLKEERIYLGGFEVYRRHSGPDSGLVRESLHIMDDKQRIAIVETRNDIDDGTLKQVTRYQFGNHLGSASLELDGEAKIISYEEYAPYGSTTYQAVRGKTETSKRYRYTGKERDEESGLYYHGARYYAAWLGRWTATDRAGTRDGLNLYSYVSNRPLLFSDPTGFAGENDWSEVGDEVRALHNAQGVQNYQDTRAPLQRSSDFKNYDEARKYGNQQAADFRDAQGMQGRSVQAGHTAAARHVEESGISKADWDKAPMQQLQSSVKADQGLAAQVTDPLTGETKTGTRHLLAQEGMIDDAVDKARPANGRLTPQGQLDAANEVDWRTKGTGLDQREVVEKRASGLFDESKAIEKSDAVKAYRADKTASKGGEKVAKHGLVGAPGDIAKKGFVASSNAAEKGLKEVSIVAAKKGLTKLGKVVPVVGNAATVASIGYNLHQGNYLDAGVDAIGEVPVVGTAFGIGYAAGTVANEFLSEDTKEAIGGTISEIVENGWENVKNFYF